MLDKLKIKLEWELHSIDNAINAYRATKIQHKIMYAKNKRVYLSWIEMWDLRTYCIKSWIIFPWLSNGRKYKKRKLEALAFGKKIYIDFKK